MSTRKMLQTSTVDTQKCEKHDVSMNADWIPLDVNDGKTFFVLSQKWGNDGFAFWVQLLRLLGRSEGLYFRLDETTQDLFFASVGVDEKICYDILNTLIRMGKIDRELWEQKQIIWCQGLIDRLKPFYKRMGRKLPDKPPCCNGQEVLIE